MFCTQCGSQINEGASFCTQCGSPVERQEPPASFVPDATIEMEATTQYQGDVYAAEPEKKRGKGKKILLIVIIVAVLAAAGVAAYLLLWNNSNATTVYYSSDEPLTLSPDAVIVAYNTSGEPMENYTVKIRAKDVDEEPSWDSASLNVTSTNGFRMSEFQELPEGVYSVTIEQDGETYYPPDFEVDSTASTDSIQLQPNPDDPDSATTPPEPEYSYEYVTTSVTIVPPADSGISTTVENEWTYPRITSTSEDDNLEAVNSAIEAYFEQKLNATKDWTVDSSYGQCINLKMTVTYMEGSYVSIRAERYYTYWGVHGSTQVDGLTFDLSTGREIDPWTVLGISQSEAQQAAEDASSLFLTENPSDLGSIFDYSDVIADAVLNSDRYYIGAEGLIITFYPYELGSFAFGAKDIVVATFGDDSLVGTDVYNEYCELY